jgi:hypothetical protein
MGSGVGVTVGVKVASGVGELLGVSVQPGGMLGRFGRKEHAVIAVAIQSPKRMRMYFILFLYW